MLQQILIAEDDKDILELLKIYLESAHFRVFTADDGEKAYRTFQRHKIDLAIVDLMMPKIDGYELIRLIREQSSIPILILSAKNEDNDKILGLTVGADDYITKPFSALELVARVQSNLRRYYELNQQALYERTVLRVGELSLDVVQATLKKNGQEIRMTATEFKILQLLMATPGQTFTKVQIYEYINGESIPGDDGSIMVHISNLREKIENDSKHPQYIKTLRGVGYKIEVPEE